MTGTRPACARLGQRLLSSSEWRDYYLDNARRLRPLPWHLGADVSADELAAIAPSLRAWQLGETSDGGRLIHAAERYAEQHHDPDFVPAVRLFIASSTWRACRGPRPTGATASSAWPATACEPWRPG
jgi:hypothetical protein